MKATNRLRRPMCLVLLWPLLAVACAKEERPDLAEVVFALPITISPGADTIARGDTLWLSVDFADSLLDLRSNRRYRVQQQNLELKVAVGFRKLLGPTEYAGSFAQGFGVINQVGALPVGGATFRRLETIYDGQRYRARVGIIPLYPGVYALNLLSNVETPRPLPFLIPEPDAQGKPRSAYLGGIYYIINNGDVHFPLQQQHSRTTSTLPGAAENAIYYEQKGTFTFVAR